MSGPVSLRLCCIAAMAPALTDATSQSRIQLPSSPPTVDTENPTVGVTRNDRTSTVIDIASVKAKVSASLTPDLGKTERGLLKPIQRNGRTRSDYSVESAATKVHKGLKDLGLAANLPEILKHITGSSPVIKTDHQYLRVVEKKMNQPSNGNGPNGTGKKFIKQTSLDGKPSLNGHANNQVDLQLVRKIPNNKAIMPNVNADKPHSLNNLVKSASGTMCHTTETTSSDSSTMSAQPTLTTAVSFTTGEGGVRTASLVNEERSVKPVEQRPVDLVKDASRKAVLLDKRYQFLLRRLRRLQGKQLESHVRSQLRAFVEFQHQNLQTVASKAIRPYGDLQSTLFNSNDVKNLSTSNLVSLVRKLQSTQPKLNFDANKKPPHEGRGVLLMEASVSAESERKSNHLRTDVRHWNDVVDSDATESSSGGESCEEWEDCPVMADKKVATPLYKRADWKWAVDRAAIVSRWTWLQAQVSDLEYRIRQQSEIHKTIRTSKGVVTLGEASTSLGRTGDANILGFEKGQEISPASVTSLMINVSKQASKLTQSLGNCLSPINAAKQADKVKGGLSSKSLNGFVDGAHTNLTSTPQSQVSHIASGSAVTIGPAGDSCSASVSPDLSKPLDSTCVAARCRPVQFYRKRKLLRTTGLHQLNHKAARVSSVKCHCYPPMMPCPMCGGRYNNTQSLDAEGMPIMEKVSLLDPAFHPVLSFPQEIGLPIHFEALLKSGEWQTSKPQPKVTLRAIAAEKRRQKLLNAQFKDQVRKNRKKLTKTAAAVLLTSAKLRSKYEGKSPHKTPKKKVAESRLRRKEMKRRRAAQRAVAAFQKNLVSQDTDLDGLSTASHTPIPSPQMKDGTQLSIHGPSAAMREAAKEARKKKYIENAYDINNIVIPYSMAASTRVEKLQYKEIQTPKWREMTLETDGEPMEVSGESEEEEVEQMTDEAFSKRHESSENEERKRFRAFVTYPPVRRSRLSRESESNTQDVPSPDITGMDTGISQGNGGQECQALSYSYPFSINREDGRRRSGSTSRRSGSVDDHGRDCSIDFIDMYKSVKEPFVPREFPLTEECYEEMKKEQATCAAPSRRTYTRAKALKIQDDMEFVNPLMDQTESPSAPMSPAQSMTSNSTVDDINDPEWNESKGDRRSSISMKQSKR